MASVRRDGAWQTIPAAELVLMVVLMTTGDLPSMSFALAFLLDMTKLAVFARLKIA